MEPALSGAHDFFARKKAQIRPFLGDGSTLLIGLQGAQIALRFISNVIIARFLAPEAFGVIGIIASISVILTMISDMGMNAYIIRHKDANTSALQTVWTLRLARNVTLAIIMFLGADIFASAYNAPEIGDAVRVCAALFLIEASVSLSFNLTERHRGVIRLSLIEFAINLIAITLTIILAATLRSYWALIIAMFARPIMTFAVSYTLLHGPPMRLRIEREHAIELWRFWRIVIPSSIITIILSQTNVFAMANFFTLSELGKFTLAASIVTAFDGGVKQYIMRVFFPTFAQADRTSAEQAKRVFYASRRRLMLLFALAFGGLAGGAEFVVRILYNDQFNGAGLYALLLAIGAILQLSIHPAGNALITKGFLRFTLNANILRLGWYFIVGGLALINFGPIALIAAIATADLAVLPYAYYHLKRFDLLNLREESLIFGVAILGAAIGSVIFFGAEGLVTAGILPRY